jgi:hypothetical protein
MTDQPSHVKFVDVDGDVHVAPIGRVHLDSEVKDNELNVIVDIGTDFNQYEIGKEEFARLLRLLCGE